MGLILCSHWDKFFLSEQGKLIWKEVKVGEKLLVPIPTLLSNSEIRVFISFMCPCLLLLYNILWQRLRENENDRSRLSLSLSFSTFIHCGVHQQNHSSALTPQPLLCSFIGWLSPAGENRQTKQRCITTNSYCLNFGHYVQISCATLPHLHLICPWFPLDGQERRSILEIT